MCVVILHIFERFYSVGSAAWNEEKVATKAYDNMRSWKDKYTIWHLLDTKHKENSLFERSDCWNVTAALCSINSANKTDMCDFSAKHRSDSLNAGGQEHTFMCTFTSDHTL